MGIDVHTIEQVGNTSNFARTDRVLVAAFPQTANPAGASAGASVTVTAPFSAVDLPAVYSVIVSGLSQDAFVSVTNRSHTGFSVTLTPTASGVTLASGTFDVIVVA
jgi:hypothetical protein